MTQGGEGLSRGCLSSVCGIITPSRGWQEHSSTAVLGSGMRCMEVLLSGGVDIRMSSGPARICSCASAFRTGR